MSRSKNYIFVHAMPLSKFKLWHVHMYVKKFTISWKFKVVSDLKASLDYARSQWKFELSCRFVLDDMRWKKSSNLLKKFYIFHNIFHGDRNNPGKFLNQRRLYQNGKWKCEDFSLVFHLEQKGSKGVWGWFGKTEENSPR